MDQLPGDVMRDPGVRLLPVCALLLLLVGCNAGDRPTWKLTDEHTKMPLSGKHALLRCVDCHGERDYSQVVKRCVDCHIAAFDSAAFHQGTMGTDLDCSLCHTPAAWLPASFDHTQSTFPLTGLHQQVTCTACHVGGAWAGQPTDCEACHWTRHQDDPWSLALGQHCADCHATTGWPNVTYDHLARTGFALTGAHAGLACTACHPTRQPAGTPAACNACHATAAQNAGHPAFATGCTSCHTAVAWSPSTFNHEPLFPIAQGNHSGIPCVNCHTGTTFADFTCITCHPSSRVVPEHTDVPGFVYSSAACYSCHPTGRGGD
jgi:hypothetical protein